MLNEAEYFPEQWIDLNFISFFTSPLIWVLFSPIYPELVLFVFEYIKECLRVQVLNLAAPEVYVHNSLTLQNKDQDLSRCFTLLHLGCVSLLICKTTRVKSSDLQVVFVHGRSSSTVDRPFFSQRFKKLETVRFFFLFYNTDSVLVRQTSKATFHPEQNKFHHKNDHGKTSSNNIWFFRLQNL